MRDIFIYLFFVLIIAIILFNFSAPTCAIASSIILGGGCKTCSAPILDTKNPLSKTIQIPQGSEIICDGLNLIHSLVECSSNKPENVPFVVNSNTPFLLGKLAEMMIDKLPNCAAIHIVAKNNNMLPAKKLENAKSKFLLEIKNISLGLVGYKKPERQPEIYFHLAIDNNPGDAKNAHVTHARDDALSLFLLNDNSINNINSYLISMDYYADSDTRGMHSIPQFQHMVIKDGKITHDDTAVYPENTFDIITKTNRPKIIGCSFGGEKESAAHTSFNTIYAQKESTNYAPKHCLYFHKPEIKFA